MDKDKSLLGTTDIVFVFNLWVDILATPLILLDTVNSLVSDHPCCMTKWLLTGDGCLRENSRK